MVKTWNDWMATIFKTAWVLCLNESMSIWHNCWFCLGWVFCPRKPHPFGNKYHTLCCGYSKILFWCEMVEGKDRPAEVGNPKDDKHGKTVGLLLWMCSKIGVSA